MGGKSVGNRLSGALGRTSLETPQSRVELLASYVAPPLLGESQSTANEDNDDNEEE